MNETRSRIPPVLLIVALIVGAFVAVPARAAFPGSDGRIAYNAEAEIYSVEPDGTEVVNLTNHPANDVNPAWSPDGRRLAFVSDRSGVYALYVMAADGSGVTHVVDGAGWPTWSPTGQQIAFARSVAPGDVRIVVTSVDGAVQTQLTSGFVDLTPAWSPDGQEIAFARFSSAGDEDIFAIRPDGTGLRQVTTDSASNDEAPNWSPDGSAIVFSRSASGGIAIHRIARDGSNDTTLVAQIGSGMAVYSPDGLHLAFTDRGGLYVSDSSGGSATQIGFGDKPDWQPIGTDCASGGVLGATLVDPTNEETGPISSPVHGSLEPALAPVQPARSLVHEVNCDVVVTVEETLGG